jgi:N-acetylmuramoyl-L-alanine amidase
MPSVGLDIGHGANTFPPSKGVYLAGKGYPEHSFNSQLGIALEKELERHGIKVHKIQEPFSNDVPLTTRTNFYNARNVDLVWSLHANYSGNKDVEGVCSFYWHDHKESERAARLFVDEVKKAGFKTHGNGLHASMTGSWTNLHIVRETKMTAVLTENGFMSNPNDFKRLFQDKSYIEKMAVVHAKAICRFFNIKYKEVAAPQQKPVEKPKEEVKIVENAIIINSVNDYPAAELLAKKINCPIYPDKRTFAESKDKVKHMYVVGGDKDGIKVDKITLLAGPDRLATYAAVNKAL